MGYMNVFRILADVSHTASKCILIWSIHSNRSSEGVSLLTQTMYLVVFLARYLDLFWVSRFTSWWNFILKIFYITSSIYIVVLMTRVFARTREREKAWKLTGYCLAATIVVTPLINLIFRDRARMKVSELAWTFSIVLESVCVLPQLLLLRQTTVPTVIDSLYLVTLGSYRAFYILNWIYRGAFTSLPPDPVAVIFGIVQTAFYLDFAWVYWSRQRVKLRRGGVVDAEDLGRGWLVNRFVGGRNETDDDDVEADVDTPNGQQPSGAAGRRKTFNRWGSKGVSISADDTLLAREQARFGNEHAATRRSDSKSDEQEAFLSDDDGVEPDPSLSAAKQPAGRDRVLNSDSAWRNSDTGHGK